MNQVSAEKNAPSSSATYSNRLWSALHTGLEKAQSTANDESVKESQRLIDTSFHQKRNKGTQFIREFLKTTKIDPSAEISDNVLIVPSIKPLLATFKNQVSIITEEVPYNFVKAHHPTIESLGPVYEVDKLQGGSELTKLMDSIKADNKPFVLGIGGGRTLDILKFVAMELDLVMLAIPSSFTTHVYASPKIHALPSIKELGHKLTIDGPAPHLAVLDADMLTDLESKNTRLIYAGFGDIMAFINAREDWHLSCDRGHARFSPQADAFVADAIRRLQDIDISGPLTSWMADYSYIQVLLCNITDWVGSAPASGAEHLFAKCAEDIAQEVPLHGELVALGTLLFAKLRNKNLDLTLKLFEKFHLPRSLSAIGLTKENVIEALNASLEYGQYKKRFTILDELESQEDVFNNLIDDALATGLLQP